MSDLVHVLLEKGADVHARDSQGETAISMARANGNNEIVDLLAASNQPDNAQP